MPASYQNLKNHGIQADLVIRHQQPVIEVAIHFGRADARVEREHIGTAHWVNLWATQNGPTNGVRIFCTTAAAAEVLAEAFVACGARRVNRDLLHQIINP